MTVWPPDGGQTSLIHPVFQLQPRYPLKLPHIIRHQDGAGRNGMPGNECVVRADRRPGEAQRHFNVRGCVHRGAIPGQEASRRAKNASTSCT